MHDKSFTKSLARCAGLLARTLVVGVLTLVPAASALAKVYEQPRSSSLNDRSEEQVERKVLRRVDSQRLLAEDETQGKNQARPGPQRFAVALNASFTLTNSGTWQNLPDGRLWRLRLQSPGAKSQNLGITRFEMPRGAKLWIYDAGRAHVEGPYTAANRSHLGSLWTPVIEGEEIVVEVFVPAGVVQPTIQIGRVNQGYRGLDKVGEKSGLGGTEGTCNNDVVCSVGNPWADQIRAVGVYTINGTGICTGTLMNDTAVDHTPYFLSANHCGVDSTNDATVVVYWNFQSATCGTHGPGSLTQNQTGSTYRASSAPSDFLLFQLSAVPDPSFNVFYSGWDASGTAPTATVGIHHPLGDVKAISFANNTPETTAYFSTTVDPTGNHWRVLWNSGVTEPGSSGSCLFDGTNRRCIGQLHGGPSICGGSDLHDYYGRLSVSWNGGGTAATRLRDWLDNANTGALTNEGDPHITTANGVHYDFQGAGEYVSLRSAGGLEIQTRQVPIATTFNPGADPHDGIAACVSLNNAVAARVGTHRVTYEPNLSGVPDPTGLQLRVDGALTSVGANGHDLGGGGRITRTAAAGGLSIQFPDDNVLLVTPGWWANQSKWYLNVDVVRGPATGGSNGTTIPAAATTNEGIMGPVPRGSWLPALPGGASMGAMPSSVHQRYVDLYQKFGEAWRVTDATSLFDYAPGTSTSTFTLPGWPRENPPCTIEGVTPVEPAELAVAERVCRRVVGKDRHADCVFDVRVTGNVGFAATYMATQQVIETATAGTTTTSLATGKLAVFVDVGASIPQGAFSTQYDTGFSFNAGVEYLVNSFVSLEGIYGYHRFNGASAGALNVNQYSANAKVYLSSAGSLRPFLNGGIGAYAFSPGSSQFGGNIGAGVFFELSPQWGLQGSYNLHTVNTRGDATRFSTLQGGIRFAF